MGLYERENAQLHDEIEELKGRVEDLKSDLRETTYSLELLEKENDLLQDKVHGLMEIIVDMNSATDTYLQKAMEVNSRGR